MSVGRNWLSRDTCPAFCSSVRTALLISRRLALSADDDDGSIGSGGIVPGDGCDPCLPVHNLCHPALLLYLPRASTAGFVQHIEMAAGRIGRTSGAAGKETLQRIGSDSGLPR